MSRKRTFQDTFSTEENDQSDNVKKKKSTIIKLQPSKTEANKLVTRVKNIKNTKIQVSAGENTTCGNNNVNYNSTLTIPGSKKTEILMDSSMKTPIKDPAKKRYLKKRMVNHVNKDVKLNNLEKNDNTVSSKSTKLKASKSSSLIKVKFALNNLNNNGKSTELETANDLEILKTPPKRKGYTKSVASVKNKSTGDKVMKDDPLNKFEKSNNLVTSKITKTKRSKSITPIKTKSVSNIGNKNDGHINSLEINNDIKPSKPVIPVKTKYGVNSINKNGASDAFEENGQSKVNRKRVRFFFNETQPLISNELIISNHIDLLKKASVVLQKYEPQSPSNHLDLLKKASVVLQKYEPQSPSKLEDNTMILRSNNKPPKIKKKWSDKWSKNKLSNCGCKLIGDNRPSVSKIEVNNCDNTIKKPLKVQKPKTTSCQKLKTKMLEKLDTADSLLVNILNTCDIVKNPTTVPGAQNCGDESIVNTVPIIEPSVSCNNAIEVPTEISGFKPHSLDTTPILSGVSTLPPTSILPSSPSATVPSTSVSPPSVSSILPSTSSTLPSISVLPPSISNTLPSTSTTLPLTSSTLPSTSSTILSTSFSPPSISNTLPSTSTMLPSTSFSPPSSISNTLPSTSTTLPSTFSTLPSTSSTIPSTSFSPPSISNTLPSTSTMLPSTSVLPSSSISNTLPSTSTTLPSTSSTIPSTSLSPPSISNTLLSTSVSPPSSISNTLSSTFTTLPSTSSTIPSTSFSPPSISNTLLSTSVSPPSSISNTLSSTSTMLPSTPSTLPTTFTEVPNIVYANENYSQQHFITYESINDSSYIPVAESEISYGINILSEAISRQCNESMNNITTTKSVEQNADEKKSLNKQTNSSPRSKLPSAKISSQKNNSNKTRKAFKRLLEIHKESIDSKFQLRINREIFLLSKRFNVAIEELKKTVLEEPLSVFQSKYSALITPSMLTVSPIVKNVKTKSKDNITGSLDVEYKVERMRESAAYEKTNLIDLMAELSKTMPSWSLCIVTNPQRYVISHTCINKYGVPFTNKSIVFDECFRASVYINQCLEYTYCKHYVTAAEIINLIKDLNSL